MKAEEKKSRKFRRTVKKAFNFFLILVLVSIAAVWLILNYSKVQSVVDRFTIASIDTSDMDLFYELLAQEMPPGRKLLNDRDLAAANDLTAATQKLQDAMGLSNYSINLEQHTETSPPGYIRQEGNNITIFLSTKLASKREQICVLVHELGHIYVWALPRTFSVFDQEKLVDTSCMFLGMGVLYLNGMKDEFTSLPEGGYQSEKKTFGYLTPEQFGYLLARYGKDRGIAESDLKQHLNDTGWRYYKIGRNYLKKKTEGTYIPGPVLKAQSVIRKFIRELQEKLYETRILRRPVV